MLGIRITVLDALGVVLIDLPFLSSYSKNQNLGFLLGNEIKKSK